jgi:hypothetical protein
MTADVAATIEQSRRENPKQCRIDDSCLGRFEAVNPEVELTV